MNMQQITTTHHAARRDFEVVSTTWAGNLCMTIYSHRGVNIVAQYEIGDEDSEIVTCEWRGAEIAFEASTTVSALDAARMFIDDELDGPSDEDQGEHEHRLRAWQLV